MKIDVRPRKRNARRPAEKSAPGFLQWLRGRECAAVHFGICEGKIEAAHTYGAGDKGIGTKSNDAYAIPLCSRHHRLQHDKGWRSFEGVYLGCQRAPAMAEAYWKAWPGRAKWERDNG